MTILTKPNVFVQIKKDAKCPEADESILAEEEKVETYSPPHLWSGLGLGLMVVVVLALAMFSSVAMVRRCLAAAPRRYQGYCSIPIGTKFQEAQLIEPNYRVMPLRWSSASEDVHIFGGDELSDYIREELEIADQYEKITVFENGRETSFVHDFGANLTGIVDADRCFTMELDPAVVLAPEAFVLSIEAGGDFDVTRVRSSLRAVLPALRRGLPELCRAKPVYRLLPDSTIRKRSVEQPPAHYIQFSGRRVQEIEISNIADIIRHEQRK